MGPAPGQARREYCIPCANHHPFAQASPLQTRKDNGSRRQTVFFFEQLVFAYKSKSLGANLPHSTAKRFRKDPCGNGKGCDWPTWLANGFPFGEKKRMWGCAGIGRKIGCQRQKRIPATCAPSSGQSNAFWRDPRNIGPVAPPTPR